MKNSLKLYLTITFLFIFFSVNAQYQIEKSEIKDINNLLNTHYTIENDFSKGLLLQENEVLNEFTDKKIGIYGGIISIFVNDAKIKPAILVEYFILKGVSIQYSRWFTEDMGLGTFGFNFLLNFQNQSMIKPYIGILAGTYGDDIFVLELPVGLSYTDDSGLSLRLGVKTVFYPKFGGSFLLGELFLGWRF